MKAFLPLILSEGRESAKAVFVAVLIILIFTLFPYRASAQDEVLATVSVNGAIMAELLGISNSGSVQFDSAELQEVLAGKVSQEVLDQLVQVDAPVGEAQLRSLGMDTLWDPMTLRFEIVLPVSLTPIRSFKVARGPSSMTGKVLRPEPFSAILNVSARAAYTSVGDSPDFPFSADSNLFFNLHSWVLELGGSGDYENGKSSAGLTRARIVKDFVDWDSRLTAGLLDNPATGFQASQRLVGASFQHKPFFATRRLSPSSMDELIVEHSAMARVYLNGTLIRSERLDPGLYRIADLPFASGLNQLIIELEQSGAVPTRLVHIQPYDDSFLGSGGIDYAFALGFEDGGQGRPMGSAFLRFGLGDGFDTGVSFQAGFGSSLLGASFSFASPLGNVFLDTGVSIPTAPEAYPAGFGLSSRYRLSFPGRPSLPGLGLFVQYTSKGFTAPRRTFALKAPPTLLRLAGSTSLSLAGSLSAALSLENRRDLDASTDSTSAALTLQGRLGPDLTIAGIGNLELRSDGSIQPSLTLSLLSASPSSGQIFHYSQSVYSQSSNFDLSGEIGKDSGLEGSVRGRNIQGNDDEVTSFTVQSRARLPRADFGASASWEYDPITGLPTASLRASASGAVVLAGGLLALSRPIADSFVLMTPGESLASEMVALRLGSASNDLESYYSKVIAGQLPSYRLVQAYIDLPEAGPEIVAADPFLILSAAYRSGIVVRPSTKPSLGAGGRLLDAKGQAVAWVLGRLVKENELDSGTGFDQGFTDDSGRFEFYGLEPGVYSVAWATKPEFIMEFELKADAGIMVELGEFHIDGPMGEVGN